MINTLMFISGPEIFVILVVVVLLFGAKKIPELARGLGKGMNEFKKATSELKKEIDIHSDVVDDIKDLNKDIK